MIRGETAEMTGRFDHAAELLARIQSRAAKAAALGKNIDEVTAAITAATEAIEKARAAVTIQAEKTYSLSGATETTIGAEAKAKRSALKADLTEVRAGVQKAVAAVKTAAVTLAQIPNVNDEVKASAETSVQTETSANATGGAPAPVQ